MGWFGWDEIQDGVKLQGFATENPTVSDGVGGDYDWCFFVAPALGFRQLLTNQFLAHNENGLIECEIRPAQHIINLGQESPAVAEQFLGSPKGKFVTVTGTWSVDRSHGIDGSTLVPGNSPMGKTEIHPITSVLVEHPPAPDNSSRSVDFLVFSDDSENFPAHVPHSRENRNGTLEVPIPLGSSFNVISELNQAESKNLSVQDSARFRTVRLQIASGKPGDGKGLYHATISLPGFTLLTFLLSRGSDPSKGIREMMQRAQTNSLRGLFKRLDAGVLPPLACAGLLGQMAVIQDGITSVYRQQKALQKSGGPPKPTQDPAFQELQKEMKGLLDKMNALNGQAEALGCFG